MMTASTTNFRNEIQTLTLDGVTYDIKSMSKQQQDMVAWYVEWNHDLDHLRKEIALRELAIDGVVEELKKSLNVTPSAG